MYYGFHSRGKIKKLKIQLRQPKCDHNVTTYILNIKKLVVILGAIGSPIPTNEHIKIILDGLLEEYDSFITLILSRTDPYFVEEIDALVLN